MNGQQITGRRGSLWPALSFAFPALGLLVLSITGRLPGLAIFLVLPFAIAAALLLTRQPAFAADITSTALEVTDPPLTVSYEDIEGVHREGRLADKHFSISVQYRDGVLRLPAILNVPSRELLDFLIAQLPAA